MDSLGGRMKAHEGAYSTMFPPVLPIVMRIDGKAFHTYTKGFDEPFDETLRSCMIEAAREVMNDAMNIKCAYIQSDEITFVMVLDRHESQHWFGGNKQKIESVSASLVTIGFNQEMTMHTDNGVLDNWAAFDSRAFSLPFFEVLNNLLWRMQDCKRNAVQMIARSFFSHKELHDMSQRNMLDMLEGRHGIHVAMYPEKFILGTLLDDKGNEVVFFPRITENRTWWEVLIFGDCIYFDDYSDDQ